jgi:amino acid transporter
MAVNTAFVASSELMERVAHRYNFGWIIKTNARQSLYRVHVLSAAFYSLIILLTGGSQKILAEMYALGLVASFTINMGSLLLYRYFTGTKEIRDYHTSRSGTLVMFVILFSCLIFLCVTKPYGLALWLGATVFFMVVGIRVAKHRAPENIQTAMTDKLSQEQKDAITKLIPVATLGTADDVANAVWFFALPASRYITGQVLPVDGGMVM